MMHLNSYKVFDNINEIVNNINDMLLELNDEGFNCKAYIVNITEPPTNIPIGYKLIKTHDVIDIDIINRKPGYTLDDVREVYYRIKLYLIHNGYKENGDFKNKFSEIGKITHSYFQFMKKI